MSLYMFMLLFFAALLIHSTCIACPTDWIALNRDCCSSTFGFNSTKPTFHLAQGLEYPISFIVWNDSSHWSLGINTGWNTLDISWGQLVGNRSKPYIPHGLIDVVRIFYLEGKGLYGLQFHDITGFSPALGMVTSTYVDLSYGGRPFSGWGMITHQSALLNSLAVCFRMI